MIKASASFQQTFPSASALPIVPHGVPRDVVFKYDVETTSEPAEKIMTKKINEASLENEAFYIVNLSTVARKYSEWVAHLPRVKPYYAIKCNPNSAIIRTLASFGVNFDCASKTEIQQILGSGISPSRIIFANPTKMRAHIEYAKSSGVEMMTFDNSNELIKIAEIYPNAKLLIRIITDDSQSLCRFSTKFGTPLEEVPTLLALAKQLGLNVVGVSFHVGSGCMSSRSFDAAIRSAHNVFKSAEQFGYHFSILDLGGGWPGTNDGGINFPEIANCIRPIIDELFPEDIEIIAEPGRYFVAESHTLAVNIFAKRTIQHGEDKSFLYYVNDGVYQSFNCIFFDHYSSKPLVLVPHTQNAADECKKRDSYKCTIFGPTCDSLDCIGRDIELPEMAVGEWLYFENMGAYTVAAASAFNGFKSHPHIYYVKN